VTLAEAGAKPVVEIIEVGRFDWNAPKLVLSPGLDVEAEIERTLPADRSARRDMLLQLNASGYLRMAERGALDDGIIQARPDFALFALRDAELATEYEAEDLDMIAAGGALRAAAEELHQETLGEESSSEEMRVAQAALNRLWSLVREG
jgi:hypothetical protein